MKTSRKMLTTIHTHAHYFFFQFMITHSIVKALSTFVNEGEVEGVIFISQFHPLNKQ